MKLKEIQQLFEKHYPSALQESYDNTGIIIGNPESTISKALVCIDITMQVIEEAIGEKCNLIVSHHPLIFRPVSKILFNTLQGSIIETAIKNNIAIYAAHTNFDNAEFGMNAVLAKKFALVNAKFLKPKKHLLQKLVTFCPVDFSEKVRKALFDAGAGHIGNYSSCSYNTEGTGTFMAMENTNPFVGKKNSIHHEKETRIETIFPAYLQKQIIKALKDNHPYEEVAYDIYALENEFTKVGEGIIGELPEAKSAKQFLADIKQILNVQAIRHSSIENKKIKKIAICGGAGSFLIKEAIGQKADAYITADLKYHDFLDADKNILLIDAGHYETEQYAKEIIHDLLIKNFPKFAVRISNLSTNPISYF